jgi:hypothetical protein
VQFPAGSGAAGIRIVDCPEYVRNRIVAERSPRPERVKPINLNWKILQSEAVAVLAVGTAIMLLSCKGEVASSLE